MTFTREIDPPPALEDRVVGALRARGLIARRRPQAVIMGAIAAAVAIFVAGFVAGRWPFAPVGGESDGAAVSRFVLLLHEPEGSSLSAAEEQARVGEYRAWARQVFRDGHRISGEKLKDAPGESLSGFFIVSAPDVATARAIAASCPHNRYGGRVEVREIDPT